MYLLRGLCASLILAACQDEEVTATKNYEDGISTVVYDLPGDTTATAADDASPFRDFYFNFSAQTQSWDTTESYRQSLAWDLAFTDIYNSMLYVNNGTLPRSPGYGGAGVGAIVAYDTPYADVVEAPTDDYLDAHNLVFIGWDAYPQPYNVGWYFYEMNTHIATPIKNRTFVLRTAAGKYAKLEVINIYKGNPAVVTDLYWPAPYFTFRYYEQPDGSRNLLTTSVNP